MLTPRHFCLLLPAHLYFRSFNDRRRNNGTRRWQTALIRYPGSIGYIATLAPAMSPSNFIDFHCLYSINKSAYL